MQLLFLFLLLVVPYLVLSVLSRWIPQLQLPLSTKARLGLSIFFALAAIGHFIRTDEMAAMLPGATPYRRELIYVTGVLEMMGAIGVWVPSLMRIAGVCLILLMVGVLPANIYAAMNRVEFGGHADGPVYLLWRVPFQLFVIGWTYLATEQNWFGHRATPE